MAFKNAGGGMEYSQMLKQAQKLQAEMARPRRNCKIRP